MSSYNELIQIFESHLEGYSSRLGERSPAGLYDPARYMLSLGGKRVRPFFALAGCDLFSEDSRLALDAALAVEVFHNFSLIHDDLLDNAPVRRGQPTVHVKWSAHTAILSGDAMLVEAMRVLESYSPDVFMQMSRLLSRTAVLVCEGQQLDMEFERAKDVTVERYIHMITLKTAVLLACSIQMGAIAAKAPGEDAKLLYAFGRDTGIAFQLLDDLLDSFAADKGAFGKQQGGDILANKKTFLYLKALELADSAKRTTLLEASSDRALSAEKKISIITALYKSLEVDVACKAEASKLTAAALKSLAAVSASEAKKDSLRKYAMNLLSRNT